MRFRLFRSKAFWFGVPGLMFLLWGWWDSMGHRSAAGVFGDPTWAIEQVGGDVIVIWDSENWPDWRIFDAGHHEVSAEEASYTRRGMVYWSEQSPNLRHVFIPYYWPVLGYVAMWAGLLIWRKRKFEKRPVK